MASFSGSPASLYTGYTIALPGTPMSTSLAKSRTAQPKGRRILAQIARRQRAGVRPEDDGSRPLSGIVVPALREAIVDGHLGPGARLSEVQIGAEFGVSRTPVREAFAQLEREG